MSKIQQGFPLSEAVIQDEPNGVQQREEREINSGDAFSMQATTARNEVSSRPSFHAPINVGGFQISGLDVETFSSGTFHIRVPLLKGTRLFPGLYSDARIVIKKDTCIDLSVQVGKDEQGELCILSLEMDVNHPLTLCNPSSALEPPSENRFLRFINWNGIKDAVADIRFAGFHMEKEGKIHLKGVLDKCIFGSTPLEEVVKPETLPSIDTRVGHLIAGQILQKKPASLVSSSPLNSLQSAQSFDVPRFLKCLGAVSELAAYQLHLNSPEMAVDVQGGGVHVWTAQGPAQVHVEGTFQLKEDTSMELTVSQKSTALETPFCQVHPGLEMQVANVLEGADILAHLAVKSEIKGVDAVFSPNENFQFPLGFSAKPSKADGHLFLHRDSRGQTSILDASSASIAVECELKEGTHMGGSGTTVSLHGGEGSVKLEGNFAASEKDFHVKEGRGSASLSTTEPSLDISGFKSRIRADIHAALDMKKAQFTLKEALSASGTLRYAIDPTAQLHTELPELQGIHREGAVTVSPNWAFNVDPRLIGDLPTLLEPFIEYIGGPDEKEGEKD